MHPWRSWILLASLATFAGQAAVIYKWTDSSGLVHYSDQPVPGAEKIVTATRAAPAGAASRAASPGYSQFAITSPAPDQTFFGDDVINAHLALDPALKANQTITWHLNGRELEDSTQTATQMTLPHLDRGTYAIAATITDQSTGESLSTDSVSFFVRQPSELAPLHQRP
jgi:Domain of unknown function (DUF4124)